MNNVVKNPSPEYLSLSSFIEFPLVKVKCLEATFNIWVGRKMVTLLSK